MRKVKTKENKIIKHVNRIMFLTVICLLSLIILKVNPSLKNKVYQKVFENNISFAQINNIYQKYLGSALPFKKEDAKVVSSENLEYKQAKKYKDGVKLTLNEDYLIPSISSGLIIYAGEKDGYGNTIILQRPDNVEVWYCNLESTSVSLYDYVKQTSTIGKAKNNILYMVFVKDGKKLDYKKYI